MVDNKSEVNSVDEMLLASFIATGQALRITFRDEYGCLEEKLLQPICIFNNRLVAFDFDTTYNHVLETRYIVQVTPVH